jgi:hypothetical protein
MKKGHSYMAQIVPPPSLTAVSAPVDRFVQPFQQAAAMPPMTGLAEALAKINPALQGYLDTTHKDYVTSETAAGFNSEARVDPKARFEANREGRSKLINSARAQDKEAGTSNGDKIAASSPHFQRGFMKARINRLGMGLQDHLASEWRKNPTIDVNGRQVSLRSVDDPNAVRACRT